LTTLNNEIKKLENEKIQTNKIYDNLKQNMVDLNEKCSNKIKYLRMSLNVGKLRSSVLEFGNKVSSNNSDVSLSTVKLALKKGQLIQAWNGLENSIKDGAVSDSNSLTGIRFSKTSIGSKGRTTTSLTVPKAVTKVCI